MARAHAAVLTGPRKLELREFPAVRPLGREAGDGKELMHVSLAAA